MRSLALVLVCLCGCVGAKTTPAAKKVYTRDEFKAAVMGKTADEVIAAVGRPDQTQDDKDGKPEFWFYFDKVLNPATGKTSTVRLVFDGGKVDEVRW